MNFVYIGDLVNTHGLKGELRIISDFEYRDEVFKINNILYINNNKYIITSYRPHKTYDMVILDGINSIDEALKLKGSKVYINRNDYNFIGYLNSDLIGMDVYDNNDYVGKVIDIMKTVKYDLLVIDGPNRHMVPNIPEFINNIDIKNNRISINYIKGLKNEN